MNNILNKLKNIIILRTIISKMRKNILRLFIFFKSYKKNKDILTRTTKEEAYLKLKEIRNDQPIQLNMIKKDIDLVKEDIDISIIVPAYNVSQYIKQCLESIVNQKTNYKYELLIIDDGSTDDTLEKINEYSTFNNIYIISQENKGISVARNKGLDLCKGKYIMFVDSDDILMEDAIEDILHIAYKYDADIVEGKYKRFNYDNELYFNRKRKQKINIESYKKNPEYILKDKYTGFAWGKVYKKELWNNIRFVEGLEFEDTIVKYILFRTCNTYINISNCIYGYRYNPNSITSNVNKGYKGIDSLWVVIRLNELCEMLNLEQDETLYKLVLQQLGRMLFYRTYNFDMKLHSYLLIVSKSVILSMKEVRPKKLSFWYSKLEHSILTIDIEAWKDYSKVM